MFKKRLTNNQLKVIAMAAMTMDHIGVTLLPQVSWLRMIGRLAFPVYAFMVAEGCRHTRDPVRYLGSMAAMAALCQIVYFFAMKSVYMCILVTFSLSIGLILLLKNAMEQKTVNAWLLAALGFGTVLFLCEVLPRMLTGTDYYVDYGFIGVLVPVCIYVGKDKLRALCMEALGLGCLAGVLGGIQWLSLLALPLLALYNGQRGKGNMKWFFYWYYPAHLVAIYAISLLL